MTSRMRRYEYDKIVKKLFEDQMGEGDDEHPMQKFHLRSGIQRSKLVSGITKLKGPGGIGVSKDSDGFTRRAVRFLCSIFLPQFRAREFTSIRGTKFKNS